MPTQYPNEAIDTWSLVRNLFAREQRHLHHIEKLEQSLANAGKRNHEERVAYNSLHQTYERLYHTYNMLSAENQRLNYELTSLRYHQNHKQSETSVVGCDKGVQAD
ncbi:hypothetical protein N8T08_004608 [Aspergillus melleus]|uniref:Uncharacterized protein n=1 Tax=Aspergillus melleus TaxID=138277 RepID=A0ACC3B4P3_9EURO|nr:hypothetical protein N8T08_004608 [Aspergillus melleus]